MMNYEEFKDTVLNEIKGFLPSEFKDCDVRIEKIEKNNGVTYDALMIDTYQTGGQGNKMVPNIYLDKFYEDYSRGLQTLDHCLKDIAATRVKFEVPLNERFDISDIKDFHKISGQIKVKLINYEKNVDFLKDKPYTKMLDMAEVYYLEVGAFGEGMGSVTIKNTMVDAWMADGVTIVNSDILHKIAMDNIANNNYYKVESMQEVLRKMMGADFPSDLEMGFAMPETPNMFVVSTENMLYGASAMLDENLLEQLSEKCQGDYFIIPSSVHEILAVPQLGQTYEEMEDIIRSVNREVVSSEEFLSDRCYKFDAELSRVVFADEGLSEERTNDRVTEFPLSEELPFDIGQQQNFRQHRGGR